MLGPRLRCHLLIPETTYFSPSTFNRLPGRLDIRWDAANSIPFDLSEGDFKTAKFRSVFTCWQSICEYIRRKSGYEIKVKFITLIIMSWKVTEDLSPITSKFIKYLVPFFVLIAKQANESISKSLKGKESIGIKINKLRIT